MLFVALLTLLLGINIIGLINARIEFKIWNIIIIVAMSFLIGAIRYSPDIDNYYRSYYALSYMGKDPVFMKLMHIFAKAGMSYYEFQTIYLLCALSFIIQAIIRNCEDRTRIYILFALYPFVLNCIQIKNFMVEALLVVAFCCSYRIGDKKKQILVWLIFIGMATTQQLAAIIYVPFVFIYKKRKLIIIGAMCSLSISVLLFLNFANELIGYLAEKVWFLGEERINQYLLNVTGNGKGGIFIISIAIIWIIIVNGANYYLHYLNNNVRVIRNEEMVRQQGEYLTGLLEYNMLLLPLFLLNANYQRIIQNEMILVYMFLSNVLYVTKDKGGVRGAFRPFYFMFCCTYGMYVYDLWWKMRDVALYTMVIKNAFWKGFI